MKSSNVNIILGKEFRERKKGRVKYWHNICEIKEVNQITRKRKQVQKDISNLRTISISQKISVKYNIQGNAISFEFERVKIKIEKIKSEKN